MKLGWSTGLSRKVLFISLTVIVLLLGALYTHNRITRDREGHSDTPTNQQLSTGQLKQAGVMATQKNYEQAESSYVAAATLADSGGNTQEALDIMQEAEKKIPEQNLSWNFYDTLAFLAKKDNNKALEVNSLKKVIAKSKQPNSGIDQSTIDACNKRLKELGAS